MSPDVTKQIAEQEQFFAPLILEPEGVDLSRDELNGVPVEWTEPAGGPGDPTRVVLYLHGGGYSGGLAAWARRGTARLALGLGCRVVAPDYRLAPRFPFPAAHEDVLTVYQHLIGPGGYKRIMWPSPETPLAARSRYRCVRTPEIWGSRCRPAACSTRSGRTSP